MIKNELILHQTTRPDITQILFPIPHSHFSLQFFVVQKVGSFCIICSFLFTETFYHLSILLIGHRNDFKMQGLIFNFRSFIHTTSMVAVSQYVTYSNTWQRSATEYSRVTFSICNHMTARKNNIFIVV